jgi:hypothetical protein
VEQNKYIIMLQIVFKPFILAISLLLNAKGPENRTPKPEQNGTIKKNLNASCSPNIDQ